MNSREADMRIEQIGDWALEDRLAAGGKPIVVRFFEMGLKSGVTARREFKRVASDHPDARFYEVDLVENPSLAERYAISKTPMVLVFVDGVEVARHVGTLLAPTVDRILGASADEGEGPVE
jgi:thiol-disulfide isomerase/thioredoxin